MGLLNIVAIGLGLAMDAFAVSVSCGLAVTSVRIRYALKLALCFAFFQALMPTVGWLTGIRISGRFRGAGHWAAMLLLAYIGVKMIWGAVQRPPSPTPAHITADATAGEAPLHTLLLLAIATSLDALAAGVSFSCAGVAHITLLLADAGLIGFINLLLCLPGVYIGRRFGAAYRGKAEIAGGVILIFMGAKILLTHLLSP